MRVAIIIFPVAIFAFTGCSQTNTVQTTEAVARSYDAKELQRQDIPKELAERQQACAQAAVKSAKAQANAAMLGSALSMVGGFGGFAGRGGMVASQAVLLGSTAIQAQAKGNAQQMPPECYG